MSVLELGVKGVLTVKKLFLSFENAQYLNWGIGHMVVLLV